jgi:phosphoribosylformylglycinamidine synthase
MKAGVVVFPGSNCDYDTRRVIETVIGRPATYLWHKERDLAGCDLILLPGGFSYGDYLRSGAIARFSPVMEEVVTFARAGGLVLGICNGFQILLEAGMLPGAMLPNATVKFVCRHVNIRVENDRTPFTTRYEKGQLLSVPIAHHDGNYFADAETLRRLEGENRIVFRYVDENGKATPEANPNGAAENIAGVCNEAGNVLGMMPHPERASETVLGSDDGLAIFRSALDALEGAHA